MTIKACLETLYVDWPLKLCPYIRCVTEVGHHSDFLRDDAAFSELGDVGC